MIFVCPKLSLHFYFRWGNNSSVIGSQYSLPHRCSMMHLNVSVLALLECMGRARSFTAEESRSLALVVPVALCPTFCYPLYVQPHNPTVNLRTLLFYTTMKYMKLADADAVTINSPFMNFIL